MRDMRHDGRQHPNQTLQRFLANRRRGADVTGSIGSAATVLRLTQLEETREVLSVGADGKALEFQLTTQVTYVLLRDGVPALPSYTQSVTRDYSFNAQQVLAKEAEEARLRRFIQDELAELVLLRLETLLANQPGQPVATN